MEFVISRNTLLRALQHARCAIRKGELDVFKNLVMTFPDDPKEATMTIHASDGSMWITETVPLDRPVTVPGSSAALDPSDTVPGDSVAGTKPRPIAVWYSDLLRPLKSLDEQPLLFIVGEYQLTVRHTCGSFRLPLSNRAGEFLQTPCPRPDAEATDGYSFDYEAPGLRSILSHCSFAMANDELRPAMNGVYMNLTEKFADYVSSDGHKLVRVRKRPVVSGFETLQTSLILPAPVVRTLLKVLPSTGDVVVEYQKEKTKECDSPGKQGKVTVIERKAMVRIIINDTLTISFCPIDGRYPAYWSVIPEDSTFKMTVERRTLTKSVDRLAIFQPPSGLVELNVSKDNLRLNAENYDFSMSGEENIACTTVKTDGTALPPDYFLRIGLKAPTLSQTLKALTSESVEFLLLDPTRAIIIHPVPQPDVEDITMLLMPMLCNED